MLVTVTSRLRIHRDEVLCSLVKGNAVVLSFVSMRPLRIPIDDLTDEAREWLLPALAPRDIPMADLELTNDDDEDGIATGELDVDEIEADEAY